MNDQQLSKINNEMKINTPQQFSNKLPSQSSSTQLKQQNEFQFNQIDFSTLEFGKILMTEQNITKDNLQKGLIDEASEFPLVCLNDEHTTKSNNNNGKEFSKILGDDLLDSRIEGEQSLNVSSFPLPQNNVDQSNLQLSIDIAPKQLDQQQQQQVQATEGVGNIPIKQQASQNSSQSSQSKSSSQNSRVHKWPNLLKPDQNLINLTNNQIFNQIQTFSSNNQLSKSNCNGTNKINTLSNNNININGPNLSNSSNSNNNINNQSKHGNDSSHSQKDSHNNSSNLNVGQSQNIQPSKQFALSGATTADLISNDEIDKCLFKMNYIVSQLSSSKKPVDVQLKQLGLSSQKKQTQPNNDAQQLQQKSQMVADSQNPYCIDDDLFKEIIQTNIVDDVLDRDLKKCRSGSTSKYNAKRGYQGYKK